METGRWYLRFDRFDSMENHPAADCVTVSEELISNDESAAWEEARLLWISRGIGSIKGWNDLSYPRSPRLIYERLFERPDMPPDSLKIDWSDLDLTTVRNQLVRNFRLKPLELNQDPILEFLGHQDAKVAILEDEGVHHLVRAYRHHRDIRQLDCNWGLILQFQDNKLTYINLTRGQL